MDAGWQEIFYDEQENPTRLFNWLRSISYLSDAENIDVTLALPRPTSYDQDPPHYDATSIKIPKSNLVFHTVLIHLNHRCHFSQKHGLLAQIAKQRPRTFGLDMMQALLDNKPRNAIQAFYEAHKSEFSKLPAASRPVVEEILRAAWPEMPKLPELQKP